jgi:hypothetical protein
LGFLGGSFVGLRGRICVPRRVSVPSSVVCSRASAVASGCLVWVRSLVWVSTLSLRGSVPPVVQFPCVGSDAHG